MSRQLAAAPTSPLSTRKAAGLPNQDAAWIGATPQKHHRRSAMINQEVLHYKYTGEKINHQSLVYLENALSNVLFKKAKLNRKNL